MGTIGYGYGSEWHLLRYMGRHRELLNEKIRNALKTGGRIEWLDFGFADPEEKPPIDKEPKKINAPRIYDKELVGLGFLRRTIYKYALPKWHAFWPKNAQNWDAVALLHASKRPILLLIEAKAHIGEIAGDGCQADKESLKKITEFLEQTAVGLKAIYPESWSGKYYQYANRLATLYFLQKHLTPPIPAYLIFIYFTGDKSSGTRDCPKDKAGWKSALKEQDGALGLSAKNPLRRRIIKIFLPVTEKK